MDEASQTLIPIYRDKCKRAFEELAECVRTTDIQQRVAQAVRNGYAGFELYRNPHILSSLHIREIRNLDENLVKQHNCNLGINISQGIVYVMPRFSDETLQSLGSTGTVVQEELPTVAEVKLNPQIRALEQRIDKLESLLEEIYYAPGMPGYLQAESEFAKTTTH